MKIRSCTFIMICLAFFILTACNQTEGRISNMDVQIQTDTKPIYNHFPSFPYTEKMEWYSCTSDGIGLSTKNIYVFAFFETSDELEGFLSSVFLSDTTSDIDATYEPDAVRQDDTWQQVLDLPFAFQDGISKAKVMNTEVYINSNHTIVYMHAVGE